MNLVTHVVAAGPAPERVFLLAHGKGADEHDLEPLLPYLDPHGRFLFVLPRAPVPFPPGYMWYTTDGIPRGGPELIPSVDALDDALDAACEDAGFDRGQSIVGGFSQGAALSLALGLRAGFRPRPAGILAMSGFLPEPPGLDYDFPKAPPVLIEHGSADPLIPVSQGRDAARTLAENGVPVVYREYPMAHQVAVESLADAAAWLERVVAGERPSEPMPEATAAGAPDEDTLVPSVDTARFEAEVLQSDLPVIVDFWAPWCQPCRAVAPIVEQIAAMRAGSYKVVKVNIDEEPSLAQTFNVQSIPMVALFRNGRLERSSVGAKPRPSLEADLGMLVIP